MRDIPHGSDDALKLTRRREHGGVSYSDGQRGRIRSITKQIPFHIKGGIRGKRPTTRDSLFQLHCIWFSRPANHFRMRFAHVTGRFPDHPSECGVRQGDSQVWIKDQDSIRSIFQQRFGATGFIEALLVKLGILDCDGGLVCKTGQKRAVICWKKPGDITKNEDPSQHLLTGHQGKANAGDSAHAGCLGQFVHPSAQLGQFILGRRYFQQGSLPAMVPGIPGNEAANPCETWICHFPSSDRSAIKPPIPESISMEMPRMRPRRLSRSRSWVSARVISRR